MRSVGRLAERPEVLESWAPVDAPVWAVRVEIRSLTEGEERQPRRPEIPAALAEALEGARELRAEPTRSAWHLYRDGELVGTVSRPTDVPLSELLPPGPSAGLGGPTTLGLAFA